MSKKRLVNKFETPINVAEPMLPAIEDVVESMRTLWASKWLTNHGEFHNSLQSKLADKLGVNYFSLASNGTLGLLLALRALDLREGEIITTPFTFPATTHAISWSGCSPVFCDIDSETLCIDTDKIESAITENTRAILAVHVFGHPCAVERIEEIAKEYRLKIVYDAAHAFGVRVNGRSIGSFGDISCFSFHATKLFHTLEGGGLAYNNSDLKDKIYLLRNFGIENEELVSDIGINAKMNEMQSIIGLQMLPLLELEIERRAKIALVYRSFFKDVESIWMVDFDEAIEQSYQYFPIRILQNDKGVTRDKVHEILKLYNVNARKYFYPLCSDIVAYRDLESSNSENLKVANDVKEQILCLPFYGALAVEDAETIGAIVAGLFD